MEQHPVPFINLEYIFSRVVDFFIWLRDFINGAYSVDAGSIGGSWFITVVGFLKGSITVLVILLIAGIIYALVRKKEIENEQKKRYADYFITHVPEIPKNNRWEKVEQLFNSPNSSDWRIAIIEADAMLDDLVLQLGYPGENLGERLKAIRKEDFPTLQYAWEAHKVRNRIAHEGMQFVLTEREARQTKMNYETVFRDAQYL